MTGGMPEAVHYTGTMRDNARQAMTAMHDHVSRLFPDVCPMSPDTGTRRSPAARRGTASAARSRTRARRRRPEGGEGEGPQEGQRRQPREGGARPQGRTAQVRKAATATLPRPQFEPAPASILEPDALKCRIVKAAASAPAEAAGPHRQDPAQAGQGPRRDRRPARHQRRTVPRRRHPQNTDFSRPGGAPDGRSQRSRPRPPGCKCSTASGATAQPVAAGSSVPGHDRTARTQPRDHPSDVKPAAPPPARGRGEEH